MGLIPVTLDVLVMSMFNFFLFRSNFSQKNNFYMSYSLFFNKTLYFILDFIFLNFYVNSSRNFKNIFLFKIDQTSSKNIFQIHNKKSNSSNFLFLIKIIRNLSIWLLSIIFCFTIFLFLSNIRNISFNKVFFEWFLIIMFLYWLLSGFTFFIKKYQFSKYTSVIQRFWRRSFIIFWLIESGVFLTFFYLTINASEEPVYMYDQAKLFKTHLFSWRLFFLKIFLNIYLVLLSYYLLLSFNSTNFKKQNIFILSITLLLLYFVWLEFYQFFHVVNFYANLIWLFDFDEFVWNLEVEFRRTRMSNNYTALCLIAKFWHLIFIFVFWVFFILRVNELSRARYPLYSANCQNFIILYLMSWLFMYPWLKFFFRGIYDINYSSFLSNTNKISNRLFINDLKLFYFNIVFNNTYLNHFKVTNFFYFFESSKDTIFSWKKHFLKDLLISSIFYT